jgi:hypothetical protein
MGGACVDRPPSLICPRASVWRAALLLLCTENALPRCAAQANRCAASKGPGKIDPPPAGGKGRIGMQLGEKGPAPYGTQAPAKSTRIRNTTCCGERAQQRLVPSPPFGRLGSPVGLGRPF